MRAWLLIALAGVAGTVSAAEPRFDTPPSWRVKPTPEQLLAVWPQKAYATGLNGSAVIRCKVSLEGGLFDCVPVSEKPVDSGFAGAAIALTPQFLMNPALKDGKPVVSTINLPIAFAGLRGPGTSSVFGSHNLLGDVAWTAAPSYAEVVATFPEKARNVAAPGHVALSCTVRGDGTLNGCRTLAEAPKGLGFGKAALSLASDFRAPTTTGAGMPTKGSEVHLPITFAIEMLGAQPRIGKPRWVALPTSADLTAALPQTANVAGRAVMDCRVAAGGHVDDCRVTEETPAGQGLGAAALAVSGKFVLSLWTPEGLPTLGGRVLVPIRYDLK